MLVIEDEKLYIDCQGCHVFATYLPSCLNIDCCEYSHTSLIDLRRSQLTIMVTAATHQQDTALIRLEVRAGEDKVRLDPGKIVEGMLLNEATYLVNVSAMEEMEVICNSGTHSILILVNLYNPEFPSKRSFEHQSNEDYLLLPAAKKDTKAFITLLPMNSGTQSIPFTLVASRRFSKITLIEGKALTRSLRRSENHLYLIEHSCAHSENIFARINSK